jgi:hypothetical protein
VSGSSTRVNKDGTIYYRTEYEPLGGQEVYAFEPQAEFPEPLRLEQQLFNADDAMWQCSMLDAAGRYMALPTRCALTALADLDLKVVPEGNPEKITSTEKTSIIYTPTTKRFDKSPWGAYGGDSRVVPPASVPSADGDDEDEIIARVETTEPKYPVYVGADKGGVEPSQSGERRLTPKEVRKIADDIQAIFQSNPDCVSFINKILDRASLPNDPVVSKNPIDIFWTVYLQGGIFVDPKKQNTASKGNAYGGIAKRTAKITVAPQQMLLAQTEFTSPSLVRDFNRQKELEIASNVLGEVIHLSLAFGYQSGDDDFAEFVEDELKIKRPQDQTGINNPSTWWHGKVDNYCNVWNVIRSENKRRRRR